MSQGALAKASGVAQPTIWRLTSGNARGSTKIVEIANALGVRSEWLSTGVGPMRDDGQMPAISQPKTEPGPTDTFRIEALDFYVSAGPSHQQRVCRGAKIRGIFSRRCPPDVQRQEGGADQNHQCSR